ncbi:D-alanyl-D-alanine carboxypeptidase [Subtercola boreus]|uniref:D-alanyl-D-alanine carboxypeptidase n=2 Tax=Subtercola boreus TaxID=120213 RepID=A0A3E0VGU8_9MICO|nr:D-alanyl-D-alanine carboxypeptidase [Subtercola boreus]TQL54160.1 CubicO group peptidase (beta-lactamase class C family) [Subtercola boreus]
MPWAIGSAIVAVTVALSGCTGSGSVTSTSPAATPASADPVVSARVTDLVAQKMDDYDLRSVIVSIRKGGEDVVTEAFGESLPGVPASTEMHFRNGAVAISYVATALLVLVDEGKVTLDDRLSTWMPEVPHSDQVTLGELARMTSGYPDYVADSDFLHALDANPFRRWTPEELYSIATSKPLVYPPGTNWNYSHTNYILLGLALEKITGTPMSELLQAKVLGPLGLTGTRDSDTPAVPEPALHAYTSERRGYLGLPTETEFVEDSTYWNPSWTITHGAVQTTTIRDLARTAEAVGTGELLSEESHAAQIDTGLRGKTTQVPGCSTCFPQSEVYTYGLGVVMMGDWILQNPMFSGTAAVDAYLPSERATIAVVVTFEPGAFGADGSVRNRATDLFRDLTAIVAPDAVPPTRQ